MASGVDLSKFYYDGGGDGPYGAGILMMGLVKSYLEFSKAVPCGIPSFTLLGERKDWEQLHAKLERLPELGAEPAEYGTQLQPILKRFVKHSTIPRIPRYDVSGPT